jgi:hypothetical protein
VTGIFLKKLFLNLSKPPEKDDEPEGNQDNPDDYPDDTLILGPPALCPFRGEAIRNKERDKDERQNKPAAVLKLKLSANLAPNF